MKQHHHRGFVALVSVIVISAILLVLVFTLGTASFFNRYDALDSENKRISQGLAEACVQAGMLKFKQADYTSATVTVDPTDDKKMCEICSVTPSRIIEARAVYNGAFTNLRVTLTNSEPIAVRSWTEMPNAPVGCDLP